MTSACQALSARTSPYLSAKNKNKDKNVIATTQMLSLEYRQISFKLSLIGSDDVVLAFNNLFQYFYTQADEPESQSKQDPKEMMALLGNFLLEIRKSMGNESTKLDNWSMLEWFITDVRKMKNKNYV